MDRHKSKGAKLTLEISQNIALWPASIFMTLGVLGILKFWCPSLLKIIYVQIIKNKPNHGGPKREKSTIKNVWKVPSLKVWVGISRGKKRTIRTQKFFFTRQKTFVFLNLFQKIEYYRNKSHHIFLQTVIIFSVRFADCRTWNF